MSNPESDGFEVHLKIYSNEDDRIHQLGQILSTPTSRKIYQLLIQKQLNAKEIGKILSGNENPRLPNLIHHLEKMAKIGLLTTEKKLQRKNGHLLKYYKAIPMILVVPESQIDKAKNSNSLKENLTRLVKDNKNLGIIGVAALFSHYFIDSNMIFSTGFHLVPYNFSPLIVTIVGLFIDRIIIKRRKN